MKGPLRRSLSRRLLLGLIAASVAYTAGIAWLTIDESVDEVYELFDVHLAQTALALLRVTDPDEGDKISVPPSTSESPGFGMVLVPWSELPQRIAHIRGGGGGVVVGSIESMHTLYERSLRYQVISREGQLLLRSANAPSAVMTEHDGLSEATDMNGQTWKYFAVWDRHGDFRVVVSEDYDLRNRLVRSIALHVARPLVLGMPVLLLLIWLSIRQGLKPLGKLSHEISARKADDLHLLPVADVPGEVRPLVESLNDLLSRMALGLEGERRFTANAAHELRTPLAAIQAQVFLIKSAESEVERQGAVTQLQRCVERAIRLVAQMLTMARLDPQQSLPDRQPIRLAEVAESVCADLAPLALQRQQTLELRVAPDCHRLTGNADLFSTLVSNLVDNAIRYTQNGGHIGVDVCSADSMVCLQVQDDGPGIPVELRERVFERFYRVASSEQTGNGLGLAICQRIAQLHGVSVRLDAGAHGVGTTAVVCLAPAQSGPGPL